MNVRCVSKSGKLIKVKGLDFQTFINRDPTMADRYATICAERDQMTFRKIREYRAAHTKTQLSSLLVNKQDQSPRDGSNDSFENSLRV